MVKANFSFGGKLVLVLVTVVVYTFVLIAGAIGGGLYAYNNVKVGDLLNLVQQSQWISEEYAQKTIQQFIADLQKDLSAEGLTLQTVIDISPKTGEMLDGVIDNLNENGIVTIDRETLYNTPVDQLSSSLMDVAVVTATLGSMQDTMGITLPDMPIFKGDGEENGGDLYVAANSTDDGSLDKAYSFGSYTYYTKSTAYAEATEPETLLLYRPQETVAEESEGGYLTAGGRYIYRNTGTEEEPEYTRIRLTSSAVYQDENGAILFKTNELYTRTAPGDSGYSPLQFVSETPEELQVTSVQSEYLYQPLYADSEGKTLATDEADATTGRYPIKAEFEGKTLYAATDVYSELTEENLEGGVPTDEFLSGNTVYVRSDGLSDLPLISAVNALAGIFDMESLSLRKAAEYFGISLESDLLTDILDVPLAYLGGGLDEAVQNFTLDSVIELNESNYAENELLFYLAYGERDNYTFDENGSVVMNPGAEKNTVADISGLINNITIGNIVGDSDHPLMQSIADWTINDFSDPDKINSLTIGDIIKIDESSEDTAKIMLALRDIPIGEISTAIDDLTIEQMVGTIDESNTILYALRNCTLGNMGAVMQSLSLQDLFADDLYEYVYIGTAQEVKDTDGSVISSQYDSRYEQLFVWENLAYTEKTADEIKSLPADTKIYARYILAYDGSDYTADAYKGIPLYAYNPAAADGEAEYVLATYVSAWKMPDGYDDTLTYYTYSEADDTYTAVPAEQLGGTFTVDTLYYIDENDDVGELSLVPAELSIADGYEDAILYSVYRAAQKAVVGETEQEYYTQANLYYFDFDSQAFERIPVSENSDGTLNTPYLEKLTDGEGSVVGYIVHNVSGTVYTHGGTQGLWKYMLTNENGAEEIASLNDIGSLMSNISYNINHKTLREMRDDGVLDVSAAADGSDPLATEIPDILLDEADRPAEGETRPTLGDMSISELLDLTVRALETIQKIENSGFDWGNIS